MSVEENVVERNIKNIRKARISKFNEEDSQLSKCRNTKSNQGNIRKNEFSINLGNNMRKTDEINTEAVPRKNKKLKNIPTDGVTNDFEGVEKKKKKKNPSDIKEYNDNIEDGYGTTNLEVASVTRDNDISRPCVEKKKKKNKKKPIDIKAYNENIEDGCGSANSELARVTRDNDISRPSIGTLVLELMKDPSFSTLEGRVCSNTLKAIEKMGFTRMTAIQSKTIPLLLEGRDLVASAKTGSGKTLAFLIPAVELMYRHKFVPTNGVGCIIISPTRELSMQTYGVLEQLMTYHDQTYGLLMGGASRSTEVRYLSEGINIVVATPGRLLDHLQNTSNFVYKKLQCLVIDEADLILRIGFEEDMKRIINLLPKTRQTMLFSATNSSKTEALTRLALKKQPVYIGVDDKTEQATVEGLTQAYLTCPSEMRFLVLYTFLKKNAEKNKLMIFFSSCSSVQFHQELLKFIDINCLCIHGRQSQDQRTTIFFQFCKASKGVLLCTDVAARGLDIPNVDWIVQYDPPDDPKEYIHRVGRTARGQGGSGCALLFLRPEESGFIRYLSEARVPITEFECTSKLFNIQQELEMVIRRNEHLKKAAKKAFENYLRAYDCHRQKIIFDVRTLDLAKVAKSFGLSESPVVALQQLNIDTSGSRKKTNNRQRRIRRLRQQAAQSLHH